MKVFVAWIQSGRSIGVTAQRTGVREGTVSKYVREGKPSMGIPPFPQLAEECEASWALLMPNVRDALLDAYKWNRRRACAETLQIAEYLRKKVLDAAAGDELKITTARDAAKVAYAVKTLEESVTTLAVSLNLVEGEYPQPEKIEPEEPDESKEPEKEKPDVREMSEEELRKRAGADVVPMKKDGAA